MASEEKGIRDEQNKRDLEIINRRADILNREGADVLTYQDQHLAHSLSAISPPLMGGDEGECE
jgi:hypothetical protein